MSFEKRAAMEQRYIKMCLYGRQGSGKSLTALLFSEGLAQREGKKIAYIDTENSSDFYAKDIKRKIHPEAFEFYPEATRSLYDCIGFIENFDTVKFGVIIIDSITHIWDAAQLAYEHKNGKKTSIDGVPIFAWKDIKKPYKKFISLLINLQAHVIICGREGADFVDLGNNNILSIPKMNTEKETPYETPFLINMKHQRFPDPVSNLDKGDIVAFWEKDRSGLYEGKSIKNPNYLTIQPIVELLCCSGEQPQIKTQEEIQSIDGLQFEGNRKEGIVRFSKASMPFVEKLRICKKIKELECAWTEGIIPSLKSLSIKDRNELIDFKDRMKKHLLKPQ